jgi:hypothetical protein
MTRRTLLLVRVSVFLAACAFLCFRAWADQSTQAPWGELLSRAWWPVWLVMLALAAVNWGLEAAKWRHLVAPLEPMGLPKAVRATLAGTTAGLITPNRTGEPVGRVLFLSPEHRWQGGAATMLGSLAQLTTTVVLGGMAFVLGWFLSAPGAGILGAWTGPVAVLAGLAGAGSLLLFFRPHLLHQAVLKLPVLKRLGPSTAVLGGYSFRTLAVVLLLSVVRYAVFAGQYVLLLAVIAEVELRDAVLVVPMIYLMTTLLPTMLLTDLGVRGSVAVALVSPLGAAAAAVLLASIGIWLVNIALPAAVGAVIILVSRTRPAR